MSGIQNTNVNEDGVHSGREREKEVGSCWFILYKSDSPEKKGTQVRLTPALIYPMEASLQKDLNGYTYIWNSCTSILVGLIECNPPHFGNDS